MARLLVVCNTDFFLNLFLEPLISELLRRGHQVETACEGTGLREPLGGRVPHHDFAFPRAKSPLQFSERIGAMARLMRRGRYDLVNSHNRNASIVARAAAPFGRVRRSVYTANGMYFNDAQRRLGYLASNLLEAALSPVTHLTLSQTEEDRILALRRGLVRQDRIRVIGNGVDLETFDPAACTRAEAERLTGMRPVGFRIVAVGRLVQGKGFHELLEAFASFHALYPDSELVQVGGALRTDISPTETDYMRRRQELGLEQAVHTTGMAEPRLVARYLRASDLFVHPSHWEGLSRSVLEAMAMGLPILATSIRGNREMVRPDWGWLVPPRDVSQLTNNLIDIRRIPPEQLKEMGRLASAHVRSGFSLPDYTARQVDALEELL